MGYDSRDCFALRHGGVLRTAHTTVATAALRRKKQMELEMDRLQGTRLQLEMQVNTLESANFNQETMAAMKKGSEALKVIHGNLYVVLLSLHSNIICGLWWPICHRILRGFVK